MLLVRKEKEREGGRRERKRGGHSSIRPFRSDFLGEGARRGRGGRRKLSDTGESRLHLGGSPGLGPTRLIPRP